ncbi:MAG: asparagine synthetase B [Thermoleophilaceae bacterium]|nr:asparagine synthetase B [Thermoleophilaceae bacterium]
MLDALSHRGPDDEGQIHLEGSWLGHTRLSIVDISGGTQPFHSPEADLWLVGNGEVYNHEEVRLTLADNDFATDSDNEVALHLLAERGPEALGELEGMFAFIAADSNGFFVAARDPVGIKPLYWAEREGSVRFASEMTAFEVEWLPHVEAFPPGCYWTPQNGLERFAVAVPESARRPPPARTGTGAAAPTVIAATREALIDSVERQMMGDVPVGVFLSGGLDSSVVAAIAARYLDLRGERLQTFAVGTEDSPDLLAARGVAEDLGSDHHERIYTAAEAIAVLPSVVRAIEHFDPSLVRTLDGLHDLNLQRADRVTMAHGLEARVPFLDRQLIGFAMALPTAWKIPGEGEMEKRLLREAFIGWVPDEVLWRDKSQFGDGSGAASVLTDTVEAEIGELEFEAERYALDPPLRTREELAYFRIFERHLPGLRPERTVGRFATA